MIKAQRQRFLRRRVMNRRLSLVGHKVCFAVTDLAISADNARRSMQAFLVATRTPPPPEAPSPFDGRGVLQDGSTPERMRS